MSLNNLLISVFTKDMRFGGDIKSMYKRSQTLSIIYVNLAHFSLVFAYEIINFLTAPTPVYFITSMVAGFPSLIALIFLQRGKFECSITSTISALLLTNLYESRISRQPLACICGLIMNVGLTSCLSPSLKIQLGTFFAVICQFFHHLRLVQEVFQITINDEQATQLTRTYIASFNCLLFICVVVYFQKRVETHVWQTAQSNYEKSENLTKEVLQASQAKDIFVSSLSHEIRNPLNALNGSIDYLLETVKESTQLQVLNNAKLSAEILLNLANNVLDAAKLRSDKMDIINTNGSFVDIVRKAFIINSEKLRAGVIHAEAFIDRNVPESLWIDPSRLLQVMMNLMSNALKFTPKDGKIRVYVSWHNKETSKETLLAKRDDLPEAGPGSADEQNLNRAPSTATNQQEFDLLCTDEFSLSERRNRQKNFSDIISHDLNLLQDKDRDRSHLLDYSIEPWNITQLQQRALHNDEIKPENGYLRVQMSDTGSGIPQDRIPRLFNMFEQAHQSVNTMHGGTGLGLWISKQLCQKMGGDITLYSTVNQGTSFVFYIPVNNDRQNQPVAPLEDGLHRDVNVLVVDDYAVNRDLHQLLLQREGANVLTACNGREAVEKYESKEEGYFDVIMMDVFMPEVDGFEAVKAIRRFEAEHERRKKVDICFVSGEYFDENEVMESFKRSSGGVEASVNIRCMRKPIDIVMIRNLVRSYQVAPDAS